MIMCITIRTGQRRITRRCRAIRRKKSIESIVLVLTISTHIERQRWIDFSLENQSVIVVQQTPRRNVLFCVVNDASFSFSVSLSALFFSFVFSSVK